MNSYSCQAHADEILHEGGGSRGAIGGHSRRGGPDASKSNQRQCHRE
jgi:hypothetical protein